MAYDETIEEYLKHKLNHALDMHEFYTVHTFLWGVPCGPTLSMIYMSSK